MLHILEKMCPLPHKKWNYYVRFIGISCRVSDGSFTFTDHWRTLDCNVTKTGTSWLKITPLLPISTFILLIAVKLKIKSIKLTYIPRSGNSLNPTVNPTNSAKIERLERLNVPQVSIFVSICGMPRSGVDSADEIMWSCSKNKQANPCKFGTHRTGIGDFNDRTSSH